jgi:hypothetical protein
MALTSPGVEVTIIDESQYIPSATNSVPYILLVTAQNKISGAGIGVAAGTLAVNANQVREITSQRDLLATYGNPFFYKTSAGTPINGYELNEYGLLAAYSALGVSNRCYVQRADIDLAELTATLIRPTGAPNNGTYWLDTANTAWGLFQWSQTPSPQGAFTNKTPIVITDDTNLETSSSVPKQSIGNIGDYAVTATADYTTNPMYFKRGGPTANETTAIVDGSIPFSDFYNTWVQLGSNEWKTAWPAIQGTTSPLTLPVGNSVNINGTNVVVASAPDNTVEKFSEAINTALNASGVYSSFIGGRLQIYGDSNATYDSTLDGKIQIANQTGTPLTTLGITPGTYNVPQYLLNYSYNAPRWATSQSSPAPTGSVWQKANNVNLGTNLVVKKYNSTLGTFVQQNCPIYATDGGANYALDPSGGGTNIPAGSTMSLNDGGYVTTPFLAELTIFERYATGPTIISGDSSTPGPFVINDTFTISYTQSGSAASSTPVTATLLGTTTVDFVTAALGALGPNSPVTCTVDSAGAIVFTHSQGGAITLIDTNGSPVTLAGFNTTVRGVRTNYVEGVNSGLILSNWVTAPTFTYTAGTVAPGQDPANGRQWYYSSSTVADIMIQDNGSWQGYRNVTNDVRGDDLSITYPDGPIFAATAPTSWPDENQSPLQLGDLWINTGDLENYPLLYRWSDIDGTDQWVLIDNTDQITSNGVLFADARWAPNGTTNPITDPLPTINSLLISDYLDLDAPDANLYPQGMLLWNTRRSGFNVKAFSVNYFNTTDFPGETLPAETDAWVTQNPTKTNGSPYMGRQAQRVQIVQALKAAIDTSTNLREEQKNYNLISCPQYPELISNMIALNNERKNTAFVIGDTPLRLSPEDVVAWANNNNGDGIPTGDGLVTRDVYCGVFYPSCQTTDTTGAAVVQPPSHMMIRTIIRNDEVAYPWLAPAGTRRGVIDNAAQIGYINTATGEFESLGVRQGLRDVLYQNSVNPITFIPGVGITNFGNKTTTTQTTALDRINVARLVAFIRGRLDSIGKQFLFEPNDQITRNEITNVITSLMIDLVAKRGIYDYLVVCDLTNNTPARIDRNELYVDIAIEPVKAVEFIYIPVRIKNTGEISAGLAA